MKIILIPNPGPEPFPAFDFNRLSIILIKQSRRLMMRKGMESLYHVAIAVRSIEEVEKVYETALGLKVTHREIVEEQGVKAIMLEPESGGTAIELLEPLGIDSPISKFIEKRGEGMHHICFKVDDIESVLKQLKEQGIKLIDETPRPGAGGTKVAFIHPKSLNGVLIELAEVSEKPL
jgi:methylmalonyl-CoA/ethylmalonyl-CoA epimerase